MSDASRIDATLPLAELEQLDRLARSFRGVVAPEAARRRLAAAGARYLGALERDPGAADDAARLLDEVLWDLLDEAAGLVAERWAREGNPASLADRRRAAVRWLSGPDPDLLGIARLLAG